MMTKVQTTLALMLLAIAGAAAVKCNIFCTGDADDCKPFMDALNNVKEMDCVAGAVCTKYTLSHGDHKVTRGSCIDANHCSSTPPAGVTMSDCTTCTTDLCNKASSAGRMIPQTTLAVLLAALPLIANLRH